MREPTGGRTSLTDPFLQKAIDAIDATAQTLSGDDWLRAGPGRWNCGQILEHLGKAYGSTAYIFDKCLADGEPKGRTPSWRQRLFIAVVVDIGYFPTGVQAPEVTRPTGLPADEALAYARETLTALDAAAARCLARFGARARIANHPILGGFTVPQWQRFHWLHTRHHMRQMAQRGR
jgi:hypothetical protein